MHDLAANDATDILEMAASLIVMFSRLCKEKKKVGVVGGGGD